MKFEKVNKKPKEVVTSSDVSDSEEYRIEKDSDTTSNKNCNISNLSDVLTKNNLKEKDEDISNSNDDKETSTTKSSGIQISNDVSASEDSNDTNVNKNNVTNSNGKEETNDAKPSKVRIRNDISGSEDSDDDTNMYENKGNKDIEDINILEKINEKIGPVKLSNKQFIKEKFLVGMPEDFYQFWEYCKKIKPTNPLNALQDIGLKLVGPFDVVAGRFDNINKSNEEYLLHWRYYHDPPEFQTVLKGDDKTGYHIGYFRDCPDEPPIFLANSSVKRDGVLHQMGPNIFAAVK